jgi:hypothetical protein
MQMKRSPPRDSTLSAVSARCGGGRCRSLSVVSLSLVALVFYSSWEALSQQQKQQPAQEEDRESCETAGELFTPTLSHWPLPTDVSEIVQGLGLLEESSTSSSSLDEQPAICVFERNKLSLHFPHAMQQLYACVSFWLSAPQQKRPRVLEIVPPPAGSWLEGLRYRVYERRNRDNPFLASFYASLTASLGVTIVEADAASANAVRVRPMVDAWKDGYQLLPAPTAHMRQAFWDERQLSTMPVCAVPIRIGILNRQKNRSILNIESLRQAVQQHTGQQEIAVVYFEDKSFDEQLAFLSQTDILISPHGAQLTGIPFMPTCGGGTCRRCPSHRVPCAGKMRGSSTFRGYTHSPSSVLLSMCSLLLNLQFWRYFPR